MTMDRREFLRSGVLVGAGVAAAGTAVVASRAGATTLDATGPATVRSLTVLNDVPAKPGEDVLLRMQRELARAMAKPVEARRWIMVIDTRKCVGCHACTIGCVAENHLPPGVVYRPVLTEEGGAFPNPTLQFTPRPCMHCDAPSCTEVCPVQATWKRPDGVVAIDYDRCIGCRYCLTACPYGARTSDFGERYTAPAEGAGAVAAAVVGERAAAWEHRPSPEYAKAWSREGHASPVGNARKCHFCLHRLEVGQLPVCVTTCIARATAFGDAEDPRSLVSELVSHHRVQTLLPHMGTRPRVFYVL